MTNGTTYEMLWDCHYCDTKKLLGLTHRFCPTCGAPQDPSWRYYPADADKVKVENHVFTGADCKCPACGAPSSAKAKCCANCGSPLDGSKAVATRQDKVTAANRLFEGETEADAKHEKTGGAVHAGPARAAAKAVVVGPSATTKLITMGLLGVFVVIIVVVGLVIFWRKDVALTVNGHSWEREVRIETFGPVESSDWRNEIPAGAQVLSCSQQQRGTKKTPDGEDCSLRRIDNGDGTFTEKQECTTRYREEPENAEKCTYRINKWAYSRSETARGQSLSQMPAWPVVNLAMENMAALGGERAAGRLERYELQFTDQEGKPGTCQLSEVKWRTVTPGSRWKTTASVIGDMVNCEDLKPAP